MHRITHNWNLKLISLALAVMLWSHVRGEVNPLESAVVEVPLRMRVPSGFVLRGAMPTKVGVTLRGPRLALRDITGGALPNPLAPAEQSSKVVRGAIRAWVEVARPRVGRQQAVVRTQSFAPDVEASNARPGEVSFVLQRAPSSSTTKTAPASISPSDSAERVSKAR